VGKARSNQKCPNPNFMGKGVGGGRVPYHMDGPPINISGHKKPVSGKMVGGGGGGVAYTEAALNGWRWQRGLTKGGEG